MLENSVKFTLLNLYRKDRSLLKVATDPVDDFRLAEVVRGAKDPDHGRIGAACLRISCKRKEEKIRTEEQKWMLQYLVNSFIKNGPNPASFVYFCSCLTLQGQI